MTLGSGGWNLKLDSNICIVFLPPQRMRSLVNAGTAVDSTISLTNAVENV